VTDGEGYSMATQDFPLQAPWQIRKFVENERDEVEVEEDVLNFRSGIGRKHGQVLGMKGWLAAINHCCGLLRFHQAACNTPSPLRLGLSLFFFYNKIFAKIHKVYQST
jgi:hypothetical protein